jgi:hypothetical protein
MRPSVTLLGFTTGLRPRPARDDEGATIATARVELFLVRLTSR